MTTSTCGERQDRAWVSSEIGIYQRMLSGDISDMRPEVFAELKRLLNDRRSDLDRIDRLVQS